MIAPDRRGLLSKAAGILALNSLRVHSASVNSRDGVAINTFVVSPRFGEPPAAELLRQQFILALDGDLDVIGSLDPRDAEAAATNTTRAGEVPAAVPVTPAPAPPRICGSTAGRRGSTWSRSAARTGRSAGPSHGGDRRDGLDIAWAKVTTLGSSVVDVFGLVVPEAEWTLRPTWRPATSWSARCMRCCPRRRRSSRWPRPADRGRLGGGCGGPVTGGEGGSLTAGGEGRG